MDRLTNLNPDQQAILMATVGTQTLSEPSPLKLQSVVQACYTQRPETAPTHFDPDKHLARDYPSKIYTMDELGYAENIGVSPVAVSSPFQLFTPEAIQVMRTEIFKPEVLEKYKFSSNIARSQLRGYAKDHGPFTYAAWTHPETLALISKVAGIELVPVFDYEIGHINSSSKTEAQVQQELSKMEELKQASKQAGGADEEGKDATPIVGWHTDSYPFVCVLMMSNVDQMTGGETAIRTSTGDVIRVRGPTQGCAVVMQGRYIMHQAVSAAERERITSVTSFRPKSALSRDDSELRTVRGVSDLSELYYEFAGYRLDMMQERIASLSASIQDGRRANKKFPVADCLRQLGELSALVEQTKGELVPESQVQKGFVETVDLPDVPQREA